MTKTELQTEALSRAQAGQSFSNYPAIIAGFLAKGIAEADILPRENVLTYHAWRAVGRQVKKGEHGVKVITFVPITKEVEKDGKAETIAYRRPWTATVFHFSQTDSIA